MADVRELRALRDELVALREGMAARRTPATPVSLTPPETPKAGGVTLPSRAEKDMMTRGPLTFLDNTGQHSTSGHISSFDPKNGVVQIKKENGRNTVVPLQRLSPESRDLVYAKAGMRDTVTGELRPDLVKHAKSKIGSKPIDRATAVAKKVVESTMPSKPAASPAAARPAPTKRPMTDDERGARVAELILQENGGDTADAHAALYQSLLASGASKETAMRVAARDIARAQLKPRSTEADVQRERDASMNEARAANGLPPIATRSTTPPTKAEGVGTNRLPPSGERDESGRDWSNWVPGMPLPAMGPDGSVLADNARRAREAERKAENDRKRNEAIGEKFGAKAQQIAEDGDRRGVTDYNATRKPINQRRLDQRRELEKQRDFGTPEQSAQADAKLRAMDAAAAQARKDFRAGVRGTDSYQQYEARQNNSMNDWKQAAVERSGNAGGMISRLMGTGEASDAIHAYQLLTRLNPQNAAAYTRQMEAIMDAEKGKAAAAAEAARVQGREKDKEKENPSTYASNWIRSNSNNGMTLDAKAAALRADLEAQGVDPKTAAELAARAVESHSFERAAMGHVSPDMRQHMLNIIGQIDPATGKPKLDADGKTPLPPLSRDEFSQRAAMQGLAPEVSGRIYDSLTAKPAAPEQAQAALPPQAVRGQDFRRGG
jgi:hypothetical protein